ncbi:MAG: cytochrome, partial [Rhodospirillaceae bacterium]|nr:cytochrome [Rhodospirillaceae bacterium]
MSTAAQAASGDAKPLINVYDPVIYQAGVPHDDFTWLRENAPVYFHEEPNGSGFWALTKYDDVVRVSADPKT